LKKLFGPNPGIKKHFLERSSKKGVPPGSKSKVEGRIIS